MKICPITDQSGKIIRPDLLPVMLPVHQQLRPDLTDDVVAYTQKLKRVFSGGGRMVIALDDAGAVLGVALYRIYENMWQGKQFYVDDLVADESRRSMGIGKFLLDWCEQEARQQECLCISVDSGTFRLQAHKFYFREGYFIKYFHFEKKC